MVSTATMAFHYHNAPAPPWLLEIRHQMSITQLQFACITLLVMSNLSEHTERPMKSDDLTISTYFYHYHHKSKLKYP